MNNLYKRSQSKPRFFAQQGTFERELTPYSLKSEAVISKSRKNDYLPKGNGGLPLSYNEAKDLIYVDATDTRCFLIPLTNLNGSGVHLVFQLIF